MRNKFFKKYFSLDNEFVSKLMVMSVVAFPGFYKFAVVLVASIFFNEITANWYSNVFLWVTFVVSFTGVAIASVTINKDINVNNSDVIKLLVFSVVILFFPLYFFEFQHYSVKEVFVIVFCIISLGFYEVYRQVFLNSADFYLIFISAVISSMLFVFCVFVLIFFDPSNYLSFFMAGLLSFSFPMIYLFYVNREDISLKSNGITSLKLMAFSKYSLSNMMSTSLSYVIPIILIKELGENSSALLTKVFLISTFVYLIPRAISADQIPKMRAGLITQSSVFSFFKKVNLFLLFCITIALPAFYIFLSDPFIPMLLFTTMLCSQISLPFANVLMVKSSGTEMFRVNILSVIILLVLLVFCFLYISTGYNRAVAILLSFLFFQVFKSFLLYFNSKKYF